MTALLALIIVSVAVFAWALSVKYLMHRRMTTSVVGLRLSFPRGLDAGGVVQFLGGISGLLLPWWKRWVTTPYVMLETVADSSGIEHYLYVPSIWIELVEAMLRSSMPSVRYERIDPVSTSSNTIGVEYVASSSTRPLRIDTADLSAKLLTVLGALRRGERLVVQWVVSPHAPVAPVRVEKTNVRWRPSFLSNPQAVTTSEAATALRQKQAHPLLLASGRTAAQAADVARTRDLLRQVEAVWHGTRGPGVHLRRRMLPERRVAARVDRRAVPLLVWPLVLNTEELTGLIGWPIGVGHLPGLTLGTARLLPVASVVPRAGTIMGDALYPGQARPVALDVEARLRHVHVLGPTGVGKSTLLVNMIARDLSAGHGVVVLDPKGDLVSDVLDRVPPGRRGDVIVLDPADTDRPVGLNPLAVADGGRGEVVVENLVGLFKSLYHSSWGPRTDDILRATLMTLVATGGATLCEVPQLLTNPNFRRRLVGGLDDPVGLESFWGWYEGLSEAERLTAIGPVLNKLRAFTMRPSVRAIIGQVEPSLSLERVLAQGRALLVSLASGLLGEEAAHLLGALVVAELWHATKARAGLPVEQRVPVMAHLDEWQNLLHLPTPMASVLAEARGLGLGLTLAHQSLSQLSTEARDGVMSNARSRVCFQLPSSDARLVARELGGLLTPDDLVGLGAYEVVVSAFAAGSTQPPATARTRPMPPATGNGDEIREESRQRYGAARREVDEQIRARQQGPTVEAPLRRKPRGGSGRAS